MNKPKRKLNKQIILRMNDIEKDQLINYLNSNSLTFQDIMRGYVQNLITDPNNTPIYKTMCV